MMRSVLKNMPVHGGQVRQVMARFPQAPRPFIDLSTGISPYEYPLSPVEMSMLTRLPETADEAALLKAAAAAYGVPTEDMIVAGPGTQLLIALLPLVLKAENVFIFGPTYSGHEQAWRNAGVNVSIVTDIQAFKAAAGQAGAVCVVCNPNNPDGRCLPVETLLELSKRCAASGGRLIVDEAYADFEHESAAASFPQTGLMVLRSFGKTYGLPGVRLGFLIASNGTADQMRKLIGDWAVSALALSAGRQALSDKDWLGRTKARLEQDAQRLAKILKRAGLTIKGNTLLFCLVSSDEAASLWAFLCGCGIVTRAFPERPTELRFGLPRDSAGWDRLERALQEWSKHVK
ncbi:MULTISPECIES: threonine-phosphate decarboxylase CobD [unclassified Gluconobacter]|uniref:threonine-phosphate decarboxylase CobD n=1 Tax=unclassified Gluconobacter TaxID=2644261 RepID=UPI0017547912|nr:MULTISPECIES: threonine-phosphate decarboxylase CobD [unclassified Gluconobacter]GFE97158.1 threonine-phosphate decarboxylase [Gluconobacter sp. Gdi]